MKLCSIGIRGDTNRRSRPSPLSSSGVPGLILRLRGRIKNMPDYRIGNTQLARQGLANPYTPGVLAKSSLDRTIEKMEAK